MPSKPRTLAGILRRRRHADREYNRARRADPERGVEDAVVSKARWKRLCARVLRDEPVCRACAAEGRSQPATTVDHVVPVRVRPDLAFDRANCQPLCTPCHNAKTLAERAGPGVGGDVSSCGSTAYGGARGARFFSRVGTSEMGGYCTGFPPATRPAEPGNQASGADEAPTEDPARKRPENALFPRGRAGDGRRP